MTIIGEKYRGFTTSIFFSEIVLTLTLRHGLSYSYT
jgi:hypothetical protein